MATNAIITSNSLDITRVVIGEIRNNAAGGKTVPIKYNGQNLQTRIPKIFYPAGVVVREDDKTGSKTYSLLASLKGCDVMGKDRSTDGSEVGVFYNFLLDLQEKIIQSATVNSGKWFGKTRSEAVIRETFKPIINLSVEKVSGEWVPNGKYPPSLRMKIGVWEGKVSLQAVDQEDTELTVTEENIQQIFAKRVDARVVVSPSIYVTGTGFGVTWRVTMAKVFAATRMTAKQAFADLKDEDAVAAPAAAPSEEDATPDEETNEDTPPAPAPSPSFMEPAPAAPAKKTRRVMAAS